MQRNIGHIIKQKEEPLKELEKAYAQWQRLYENGGSDPFWPDGDQSAALDHVLWTLHDRQDAEQDYEQEQTM